MAKNTRSNGKSSVEGINSAITMEGIVDIEGADGPSSEAVAPNISTIIKVGSYFLFA